MLTATVRDPRTGGTLRPAAASTLAPAWLHGDPGPARVVAVFDVAVYLRRDQDVLPLLAPGALALPGGLRVASRTDLDALGLSVGDEVTVGEGQVAARGAGLVVRRTWRPRPVPSAELPPSARATASSVLAGPTQGKDDLGPELAVLARQVVAGLAEPHAGRGAPTAGRAAPGSGLLRGLVGLGPGLTPAGDDVLCGLLLGLRTTGRAHARAALAQALEPLLGRTTALSATLLRQAAQGYAVPPLVALLRGWHRGADAQQLAGLGTEVAGVGHTTGRALLLGLATVLAPPHTPPPTREPAVAPTAGPTRGTS